MTSCDSSREAVQTLVGFLYGISGWVSQRARVKLLRSLIPKALRARTWKVKLDQGERLILAVEAKLAAVTALVKVPGSSKDVL